MDPISTLRATTAKPAGEASVAAAPAPKPGAKPDPKLNDAAQGFEAIFLRQILRDLRKTATIDGDKSAMSGIYTEMFDEHLADQLSKAGGIGLGQAIRLYLQGGRR